MPLILSRDTLTLQVWDSNVFPFKGMKFVHVPQILHLHHHFMTYYNKSLVHTVRCECLHAAYWPADVVVLEGPAVRQTLSMANTPHTILRVHKCICEGSVYAENQGVLRQQRGFWRKAAEFHQCNLVVLQQDGQLQNNAHVSSLCDGCLRMPDADVG